MDLFVVVTAPGTAHCTKTAAAHPRSRWTSLDRGAKDWTLLLSGGVDDMEVLRVLRPRMSAARRHFAVDGGSVFPNAAFCEANPLDEWNFELRTNYILVRHPLMYLKVRKIKM